MDDHIHAPSEMGVDWRRRSRGRKNELEGMRGQCFEPFNRLLEGHETTFCIIGKVKRVKDFISVGKVDLRERQSAVSEGVEVLDDGDDFREVREGRLLGEILQDCGQLEVDQLRRI